MSLGASMNELTSLSIKCDDVLRDNHHLYAAKAKRKKFALIRIEVTNRTSSDVVVKLGSATLISAGQSHLAESPAVVLRKLSEFTWDFLFYILLDFHPVTAVIEACVFLTGPLYNRRLRRQLSLLSDAEMSLLPGEAKAAVIAFLGVSKGLDRLTVLARGGGDEQELAWDFNSASSTSR